MSRIFLISVNELFRGKEMFNLYFTGSILAETFIYPRRIIYNVRTFFEGIPRYKYLFKSFLTCSTPVSSVKKIFKYWIEF